MNEARFLIYDSQAKKTTSFLAGNALVPAPAYLPEIKSLEDLKALLFVPDALPNGNPIMAPANRWSQLISNPLIGPKGPFNRNISINNFLRLHPIYFYDPPELFKYALGEDLVKYALRGDLKAFSEFKKYLKNDELDKAIRMVPAFFQPFLQKQITNIQYKLKEMKSNSRQPPPHVERAWLEDKTDKAYKFYIYDIVTDALKMPSAILIPPVPPLLNSSETTYISRVIGSNRVASYVCRDLSRKFEPNPRSETRAIYSYFHLYLDWAIVQHDNHGIDVERVRDILENELQNGTYAGIALTLIGYENAAKNNCLGNIWSLINEIVNIGSQNYLPVILPRSGWFGLWLTDLDVQGFGGLLSGKYRYMPKGGRAANPDDRYGKTPLIDEGRDLRIDEVRKLISRYNGLPSVPGLRTKPDKEELDDPRLYRERFGKPMRLIHIEEARRLRAGRLRGIQEPAKHYFSKSHNQYLRDICA